jgi:hypothetical protein
MVKQDSLIQSLGQDLAYKPQHDYNYVMDRDGQILFQTKNNRWRIRGIKMTRAQIKREIKQQMLDIERRQQAKN